MSTRRRWYGLLEWVGIALALYVPCRYLLPLRASYFVDWGNHEWAIGYFGEYFRSNLRMPAAFNTAQVGGVVVPVFYGSLFYPLLGLPASVIAPGVVVRLTALAMFVAQFWLVSRVLIRCAVPRYLARLVSCMVIWAIYPLTNFYNRGALTEFVATGLLVCALCCLLLTFLVDTVRARRTHASATMFCLTLAAGTHPITALYSVPVFAAITLLLLWVWCSTRAEQIEKLRSLLPWLAPAIVCLLPWYAVVHQYRDALPLTAAGGVVFFPDSIDNWPTRFSPIAWDRRVDELRSFDMHLCPYLDAQISVPLLVLLVALGIIVVLRRRRERSTRELAVLAASIALFIVFTLLSLAPSTYTLLPQVAQMIQFAYRAITYQNLSLLLGVMVLLLILARSPSGQAALAHRGFVALAICCAALALAGAITKWPHIAAIKQHDDSPQLRLDASERQALINLPRLYYGWSAYSTNRLFTQLPPDEASRLEHVDLRFDSAGRFGRPVLTTVTATEPKWLLTNIQAFPWNQITVDREPIAEADLAAYDDKLAIRVAPGSHRIKSDFRPPSWWRVLRIISLCTLLAWLVYMAGLVLRLGIRARQSSRPGRHDPPSRPLTSRDESGTAQP